MKRIVIVPPFGDGKRLELSVNDDCFVIEDNLKGSSLTPSTALKLAKAILDWVVEVGDDENHSNQDPTNEDYSKQGYAKRDLQSVFDIAITKFVLRCDKPGNTPTPWEDFSVEHLEQRLLEEIEEWKASKKSEELIDIILMSVIVHLAYKNRIVDKMVESMKGDTQ